MSISSSSSSSSSSKGKDAILGEKSSTCVNVGVALVWLCVIVAWSASIFLLFSCQFFMFSDIQEPLSEPFTDTHWGYVGMFQYRTTDDIACVGYIFPPGRPWTFAAKCGALSAPLLAVFAMWLRVSFGFSKEKASLRAELIAWNVSGMLLFLSAICQFATFLVFVDWPECSNSNHTCQLGSGAQASMLAGIGYLSAYIITALSLRPLRRAMIIAIHAGNRTEGNEDDNWTDSGCHAWSGYQHFLAYHMNHADGPNPGVQRVGSSNRRRLLLRHQESAGSSVWSRGSWWLSRRWNNESLRSFGIGAGKMWQSSSRQMAVEEEIPTKDMGVEVSSTDRRPDSMCGSSPSSKKFELAQSLSGLDSSSISLGGDEEEDINGAPRIVQFPTNLPPPPLSLDSDSLDGDRSEASPSSVAPRVGISVVNHEIVKWEEWLSRMYAKRLYWTMKHKVTKKHDAIVGATEDVDDKERQWFGGTKEIPIDHVVVEPDDGQESIPEKVSDEECGETTSATLHGIEDTASYAEVSKKPNDLKRRATDDGSLSNKSKPIFLPKEEGIKESIDGGKCKDQSVVEQEVATNIEADDLEKGMPVPQI